MDHGSLFSCVENANLNIKEKRKHKFLCTHHFVNRHWFVNLLQDKYLVVGITLSIDFLPPLIFSRPSDSPLLVGFTSAFGSFSQ